ncbi:MAG: PASTA domain-containing protein, partial [Actinomycetota bacterium]
EDAPDTEPGTVLLQDPAEGEEVEEGTEVTLTVVAEPELVLVPPIPAGSTFEDASAILIEAGLEPAGPEEQPSDQAVGVVIGTNPAAGEEVEPASPVTIIVSSGPAEVQVPDVRCRPFGAAAAELRQAGLDSFISDQTVAVNPLCPNPNRVAAQDPGAGETVPTGTTVTLFGGAETIPTGPTGPTGTTGDED